MSKSLGNRIYLSDTADEIQKKVKSMYTDPDHLRVQDPGKIEGNTVFTYLDAFCRPNTSERYLPDYPSLEELKAHYQRGWFRRYEVKGFNNIMQETLEPIRNRRKELKKIFRYLRYAEERLWSGHAKQPRDIDDVVPWRLTISMMRNLSQSR